MVDPVAELYAHAMQFPGHSDNIHTTERRLQLVTFHVLRSGVVRNYYRGRACSPFYEDNTVTISSHYWFSRILGFLVLVYFASFVIRSASAYERALGSNKITYMDVQN